MEIVRVPIDSVKLWDKNPRSIRPDDYERLKNQLQRLGQYKPLIAIKEGEDYVVLGGNMRLRALKDLGAKEVGLSIVDAPTIDKQLEYALSDNDQVGFYETDLLTELLVPIADNFPMEDYKIEMSDAINLQAVMDEFTNTFLEEEKKVDKEEEDEDGGYEGVGNDADLPGVDSPSIPRYGELDGLPLDEERVFCSLMAQRFDVARGVCPNNCAYCFIKTSPAGKMNMPLRHVKREEIRRMILKAKQTTNFIITGVCMDPMAEGVEEPILYLLQSAISKDMQVMVMTKDPKKLFSLLTKEIKSGFKGHVLCRTSFSHPNPVLARKLEPNAPNYDSRVEGLRLLENVGVGTISAFHPFFMGHTDYRELLKVIPSEKILAEELRASKAGAKYYQRVMLTIGEDLLNYFKKWGNKTSPLFGNMHWFAYDIKAVNKELRNIRDQVIAAGKKFGTCGGMSYQCAYLNSDMICCHIPSMRVKADTKAVAALIHSGEYRNLSVPFINSETEEDKRMLLLDRLEWLNDPACPILDEESGKKLADEYRTEIG